LIEIICGEKGTGKTKRIISLANDVSDKAKGSMVFIDDDNSYMYDLGYSIRFINVTDYALNDPDMFLGFLCGLCASDFDLEYVFVDRFENVIKAELDALKSFFQQLEALASQHSLHIILSVSKGREDLPDFMEPYILA
jgi:hypothetical protein